MKRPWIFRWKGLDGTPVSGLLAVVIVSAGFMMFAASVRVRVAAPRQWVERKASVIHLSSEGAGKIWALRAREGGPFPSRLEPELWQNSTGAVYGMIGATRLSPTPYQPTLRDLPAGEPPQPPLLASKTERVFPKSTVTSEPVPEPLATRPVPVLFPLSGIALADMPTTLPSFEDPIDAAMTSASWRFIVRLRADGTVSECIGLADNPGGVILVKWLRSLTFSADLAKRSEWIGLGVGFINQAVNGSDTR